MKIKYTFATGEVTELEVDSELGELLLDLDRQEYNNQHKETRRHVSLDSFDYEGGVFASGTNVEREVIASIEREALLRVMETLTPAQRDLVQQVYFDGRTITEIAREQGVSHVAILDRLNRIYARMKKNL